MKTTIDIADALLEEAKRVASRQKTTVRALVEEGLRRTLAERQSEQADFKLRLVTFTGTGLREGVSEDLPRHLAYDLPPGES